MGAGATQDWLGDGDAVSAEGEGLGAGGVAVGAGEAAGEVAAGSEAVAVTPGTEPSVEVEVSGLHIASSQRSRKINAIATRIGSRRSLITTQERFHREVLGVFDVLMVTNFQVVKPARPLRKSFVWTAIEYHINDCL